MEHPRFKGFLAREDGTIVDGDGRVLRTPPAGRLNIKRDGKNFQFKAHVFVYECFHRNKYNPYAHILVHADGDGTNNSVTNLRLLTKHEYYQTVKAPAPRKRKKPAEAAEGQREHPIWKGYFATADGTVIGRLGKAIRGSNHLGYRRTAIDKKTKMMHVIVFECFHGPIDSTIYDVDHIDGCRTNNAIDNLQALTRSEHIQKTRATVSFKKSNRPRKAPDLPGEVWASPYAMPWRSIQVSNMGRFKSSTGQISVGSPEGVYFSKHIGEKVHKAHVIIASVWIGQRPSPVHTVDHIDRDPHHNAVSNLRWATPLEQATNQSRCRAVEAFDADGTKVGEWATTSAAARATGTCHTSIGGVLKGKLKQAGGLFWRGKV